MPKRVSFTKTRFILAEGEEDAAFARAVVSAFGLQFDVSPNYDICEIGGNSAFGISCMTVEPIVGFTAVTDVVVLADNDGNPQTSLAAVLKQIEDERAAGSVQRKWGKAKSVGRKAAGDPAVTVWTWPKARTKGCLETLLWQCAKRKYPAHVACVEAMMKCSKASKWPIGKADKARVRALISIMCRKNPAASVSTLWRDFPDLFPPAEPEFAPFANFLQGI